MDWSTIFLVFGAAVLFNLLVQRGEKAFAKNKQLKNQDKVRAKLPTDYEFVSSNYIMSDAKGRYGLVVDEQRKEIVFISGSKDYPMKTAISYRDILSSEIVEDGQTVTKTSRTSQLGGALLGGLTFGIAGAVVGGLSGSKTSAEKVSKIELVVTVNSVRDPLRRITLLDAGIGLSKSHHLYKQAIDEANMWHGRINVVIKQADQEDERKLREDTTKNLPSIPSSSVADEIMKLSILHEKKLLTDDEFSAQKQKLLQ